MSTTQGVNSYFVTLSTKQCRKYQDRINKLLDVLQNKNIFIFIFIYFVKSCKQHDIHYAEVNYVVIKIILYVYQKVYYFLTPKYCQIILFFLCVLLEKLYVCRCYMNESYIGISFLCIYIYYVCMCIYMYININ